jgi:hypothetical protein
MISLSRLTYYPIKACRGISVDACRVEAMGLENDRRMMVVTRQGKFLTQREMPRLALVSAGLGDGQLRLAAPGYDEAQIEVRTRGDVLPVRIWKDRDVPAVDQGEAAAQWFSSWLGKSVRLVHLAEGAARPINPEFAATANDQTGFADGYPILIVSEPSLEDLNSRLDVAVDMERFRPNVVVLGCEPYAEDGWRRIAIGDVEMAVVKPCPRCVVTTIDKGSMLRAPEPLRTLGSYRKQPGGAMFGQNAIPLGRGRLEVGAEVTVLETRR